jgi:sterol desaturase/sphingolipid hydroxylase (fatty acid hydroxylase superfamily)
MTQFIFITFNSKQFLKFSTFFLLWTLVEYLFHRYILHRKKSTKFLHDNKHHANVKFKPSEKPILILAIVLLSISINKGYISLLGFGSGMLCYVLLHHISHKYKNFYYLKQHHKYHHLLSSKYNFGITTNIWDIVFKTYKNENHIFSEKKEKIYYGN